MAKAPATATMKLNERALLIKLRIGVWGASKVDDAATEEVIQDHRAGEGSGKFSKRLVTKGALKEISSVCGQARKVHYALSSPWDDSGSRIITTMAYQKHYTEQISEIGTSFHGAVKRFTKDYPQHIEEAKKQLGTLFNTDDYPPVDKVRRAFKFEVEASSIPDANDFRAKLSDAEVNAISKDIEDRNNQRLQSAMNDVWERIKTMAGAMNDRLNKFKPGGLPYSGEKAEGVFKDSLVENMKELADLLPYLNLTNDARITDISKLLNSELCKYTPDQLRLDKKARKATAHAAADIIKKVSVFMA